MRRFSFFMFVNFLFWSALGLVLFLTLAPMVSGGPVLFPGVDKLEHALAFGGLAFLRFFCASGRSLRRFFWIVLSLGMLGAGIEILQDFIGRQREWADLGADLVGCIGGVFLAHRVEFLWKKNS